MFMLSKLVSMDRVSMAESSHFWEHNTKIKVRSSFIGVYINNSNNLCDILRSLIDNNDVRWWSFDYGAYTCI